MLYRIEDDLVWLVQAGELLVAAIEDYLAKWARLDEYPET